MTGITIFVMICITNAAAIVAGGRIEKRDYSNAALWISIAAQGLLLTAHLYFNG